MACTQTQSRCHPLSPRLTKSTKTPLAKGPTSLVPEAKVKNMLRDIAFVLQVSRRLSQEIGESKTCSGAEQR